jgi:putative photosynthetic complex assembly protein 2
VTLGAHGLPLLYVVALWFASTALVVWLDNRASRSFGSSLSVAGIFAIVGVAIIAAAARDGSTFAAYAAFTAAFLVWGWHEMSFLMGHITGPRRMACPAGARGWMRFKLSAQTVIYHEIALVLTLALLAALTWNQPNPIGTYAFAILFAMRLSTKLNIFMGVPNFSTEMLPPQLAYLKSYFRMRAFNPLMPVSLLLGSVLTYWLGTNALAATGDAAISWSLLTGLALLGVVEHLFLVLPIGDTALWRWAIPNAKRI